MCETALATAREPAYVGQMRIPTLTLKEAAHLSRWRQPAFLLLPVAAE